MTERSAAEPEPGGRIDVVFDRRASTFRRRLAVSAVVAIALLVGVGGVLAWRQYEASKRTAVRELESRAVLAATVFDTYFTGRVQLLETMAAAPSFVQLDEPAMGRFMTRAQGSGKQPLFTQSIAWVDLKGVPRVTTTSSGAPVNVSDRSYFTRVVATGRPYLSEGITSRVNGEHIMIVAVPTRDAKHHITGVLTGAIRFTRSRTSQRSIDLGYAGLVVLDRAGRQLTQPTFARPGNTRLVVRLRTGEGVLTDEHGLDGSGGRVVAYANAKVPRWTIVLERARSDVFAAAWRSFVLELISILVAAATVLAIVAWALTRSRREMVEEREHVRQWDELVQSLGEASAAGEVAAALGAALLKAFPRAQAIVAIEEEDGDGLRAWVFGTPGLDRRSPGVKRLAQLPLQSRTPVRLSGGPALDEALAQVDSMLPVRPGALYALPMQTQNGVTIGSITLLLPAGGRLSATEEALVAAHAEHAARALGRTRLSEREHDVALALQRSLLPAKLPPIEGLELASRYNAGAVGLEVGGDWYGAIQRPDGIVHLTVGDVAGRGVTAAALMGQLRFAFRALAFDHTSPAELARRIARLVPDTAMATATFLALDPYTGELRYTSAGHPPSILLDALSGKVTLLEDAASPPLGWATPAAIGEATVTLRSRMTLLAYTDGLVERRGESIDDGIGRVADLLRLRPELDPDSAADVLLEELVAPLAASDDIALLVVQLNEVPSTMRVEIPADPLEVRRLRARMNGWLARRGLSGEQRIDIVLAVSEACNNAVEHAYTTERGTIRLALEHRSGRLRIAIEDDGRWKETPPDASRGRGIMIMRETMDVASVEPSHDGTRVALELDLTRTRLPDEEPGRLQP